MQKSLNPLKLLHSRSAADTPHRPAPAHARGVKPVQSFDQGGRNARRWGCSHLHLISVRTCIICERNRDLSRTTPPKGVFDSGHAGLVINRLSGGRTHRVGDGRGAEGVGRGPDVFAPKPPQGALVRGHAGLVINKHSGGRNTPCF